MSLLSNRMNHASAVRVFTLCLIKSDATKSLWVCKMVKISVNHTFKAIDDIPTSILRILVIYRLLLVWANFRDLIQKTRLKYMYWVMYMWIPFVKMFAIHPQLTAPNSWRTRSLLLYRWRWSGSLFGSKLDGQSQQTSDW